MLTPQQQAAMADALARVCNRESDYERVGDGIRGPGALIRRTQGHNITINLSAKVWDLEPEEEDNPDPLPRDN